MLLLQGTPALASSQASPRSAPLGGPWVMVDQLAAFPCPFQEWAGFGDVLGVITGSVPSGRGTAGAALLPSPQPPRTCQQAGLGLHPEHQMPFHPRPSPRESANRSFSLRKPTLPACREMPAWKVPEQLAGTRELRQVAVTPEEHPSSGCPLPRVFCQVPASFRLRALPRGLRASGVWPLEAAFATKWPLSLQAPLLFLISFHGRALTSRESKVSTIVSFIY